MTRTGNGFAAASASGPWTVGDARQALATAFAQAGIDNAALDARIIVGHALALDHSAMVAAPARVIAVADAQRIRALAARRLRREPIARIVGKREFWGLSIGLSAVTLVPRPETETVVEAALAAIDAQGARSRTLSIADLGTGSGALLLALLAELPNATGIGTDIDAHAVTTARDNAQRLGFAGRAFFAACHFATALAGPFDLVVSNPPYVRSGEIDALEPEVREYDPRVALDGGDDGLAAYRAIAREAATLIGLQGHLFLELGAGQASEVEALFDACGLAVSIPPRTDLAGIARVLHMQRLR